MSKPAETNKEFADKRKRRPTHVPEQVKTQQRRSLARSAKRTQAAKEKARNERLKLERLQKKVETAEQIIESAKSAPTPAQQRKLIFAKCEHAGYDPIDEMIKYAKNAKIPMKDRMAIHKEIASLCYAKPKSIDVQADVKSEQVIHVMDFASTTQAQLKQVSAEPLIELADDSAYDEFLSPEELDKRKKLEKAEKQMES